MKDKISVSPSTIPCNTRPVTFLHITLQKLLLMKSIRLFPHYLVILCLTCIGLALPARGQQPKKANPRVTFTLLYAGADQKPYTVTVPKTAEGNVTVPIPRGDGTTWLVTLNVDWDAHELYVAAIDPKTGPTMGVFGAYYDVTFDKPISLIKTSTYAMELTMTTE